MKATRNLKGIAEERAGRKLGSLRLLNSYWVCNDAVHNWYEVIMVDPSHKAVRDDPRINWICNPVHKHRELKGLTSSGRRGRGLRVKGKMASKIRPSKHAVWKRHQKVQLRRRR